MKKEYKYAVYGIIAVVILFLAYPVIAAYFAFQQVNVNPNTAVAKLVTCDISIKNPFGIPLFKNGDLLIESSPNCQQTYVAFCGRFGVFSDTGQLKLSGIGGIGESVKVDVYEGSSKAYTLKWCGSKDTSSLTASLYDDNGNKLYDKDVKLQ